jgi:hypothetical protein
MQADYYEGGHSNPRKRGERCPNSGQWERLAGKREIFYGHNIVCAHKREERK